jgi:Basic region leucine zipper
MSNHRDVNVSQFIANLNSLEPVEFPNQQNHEEELSIFSNTHFFDFDMGRSTNIAATVDDLLMQQEKQLQNPKGKWKESDDNEEGSSRNANGMLPLDFDTLQQFSLAGELPIFNNDHHHASTSGTGSGIATPRQHPSIGGPSSVSTTPTQQSSLQSMHTPEDLESSAYKRRRLNQGSVSGSAGNGGASSVGSSGSSSGALDANDANGLGLSAEEDKRRRNTAASARFRIKKKLREQEMERTTREMQEKIQHLETRVTQLQMENRWLRNIVVEKNEARDVSELLDMKSRIIASADPLVKAEDK